MTQQRIVVNYEVLTQSKTSLARIRTELEHTKQSTEELLGHLGHFRLTDAMTEFSSNWDRKRAKLIIKIKATESGVDQVMQTFSAVDKKAAQFDFCGKPPAKMRATQTGQTMTTPRQR